MRMPSDLPNSFASFQILPRESLRVYNPENDLEFKTAPVSARTAVKLFWLISDITVHADIEMSSSYIVGSNVVDSGHAVCKGDLDFYEGCCSLPPFARLLYWKKYNLTNLICKEKYFDSSIIGITIDAPRTYKEYSPDVPFEDRQFVFPVFVKISGYLNGSNIRTETKSKGFEGGTDLCTIDVNIFGSSFQVTAQTFTTSSGGYFSNSGGGTITISSPSFHAI